MGDVTGYAARYIDLASDVFSVFGFDGVRRYANPAFWRTLGFSPDEFTDTPLLELIHPDDREAAGTAFACARAGESVPTMRMRVRRRDGAWRRVVWRAVVDAEEQLIYVIGRDVTEQEEAEEALAGSRDILAALLDHTPAVVVITDLDGRVMLANRRMAEVLQRPIAELIGARKSDLFPADVTSHIRAVNASVVETGRPSETEEIVRLPDGDRTMLALRFPLADAEGRVYAVGGMFTDVTELRAEEARAEGALRRSEERFRAIFEDSPIGMTLATPDGRFVHVNRAFADIVGRTTETLQGMTFVDLAEPSASESDRDAMMRLLAGEEAAYRADKRVRKPDGSIAWLRVNASIVGAGPDRRVLTHVEDITAGRQAEDERSAAIASLGAAEERYRRLAEAITDYWLVGVATADGAIGVEWASPSFIQRFGYTAAELNEPPGPAKIVHPDDLHLIAEGVARGLSGEDVGLQVRLLTREGDVRTVRLYGQSSLEAASGRATSYLALQDLTDVVAAEAEREQLQARLSLSQRLESLGQLAGGVAHDFNNMLAVIINYADFAGRALRQAEDDAGRKAAFAEVNNDLAEIRLAAERAAALTRQLLIFGRRDIVTPEPVEVNDVVEEVSRLLRRTAGEHIDLHMSLAADLPLVEADPAGLGQVVMNLALNARDAMPGGGALTIETASVEVSHEEAAGIGVGPGRYVRIRVADEGTGMTPEVAARAFEPFFTTKERDRGTGLGLATVYGIITRSGGTVLLDSKDGEGTTVNVYLSADATPAVIEEPAAAGVAPGTGTVLLAEDEEGVRDIIERLLVANGYRVLVAADGEDALALARGFSGPIDLLISDVVMPRLSGPAVAQQLTAERPGLRVLFTSGYPHEHAAAVGTAGAILLEKPFVEAKLLARVKQALNSP